MLLDEIKCKKTYIGKSTMTTGNKYRVTLTHNGKSVWFIFHDNIYNKSSVTDFVDTLMSEAYTIYEYRDYTELATDFGIDYAEAKKLYRGCEHQKARLDRLFTEAELQTLQDEIDEIKY
jgi:hypothetical protein